MQNATQLKAINNHIQTLLRLYLLVFHHISRYMRNKMLLSKKQFKKLTMRGRCDKARYILADLLAMSVAADADKLNCFGSTYLINNKKKSEL